LEQRDGIVDIMEQGGQAKAETESFPDFPDLITGFRSGQISCGCGLSHRSEEISAEVIAGLKWRTCHGSL
jgi:hypothetical protein